jgi:hypothetical protein
VYRHHEDAGSLCENLEECDDEKFTGIERMLRNRIRRKLRIMDYRGRREK